jgi:hypothetical protein
MRGDAIGHLTAIGVFEGLDHADVDVFNPWQD